MDEPLGRAVGNALEVDESIAVLEGGGPEDVVEVTVALAEEMLKLAGLSDRDPLPPSRTARRSPAFGRWCRHRAVTRTLNAEGQGSSSS